MSLVEPNFSVNMPGQTIYLNGVNLVFHPIEWQKFVDKLPEEIHSEYDRLHCWFDYDNRAEVEKYRWNPVAERLEHYNAPTEIWTSELRTTLRNLCVAAHDAEVIRLREQEEALKEQFNKMAAAANPAAIHSNANQTSLGTEPVYGGVVIDQNDDFKLYSYLQDFIKYQLSDTDFIFLPDLGMLPWQLTWYEALRAFWRKANHLLDKENIIPFCASVEKQSHPNDPLFVIPTSFGCKLHTKITAALFKLAYPKIWEAFEQKDLQKIADLTNVWCRMAVDYNETEMAWAYFPQLEFAIYTDLLHKEFYHRDKFLTKEEMLEWYEQNKDACLQRVRETDLISLMPAYKDFISIVPVPNIQRVVSDYTKTVMKIFGSHMLEKTSRVSGNSWEEI